MEQLLVQQAEVTLRDPAVWHGTHPQSNLLAELKVAINVMSCNAHSMQ